MKKATLWALIFALIASLTVSCGGGEQKQPAEVVPQGPVKLQVEIPVAEIYAYAADQYRKSVEQVGINNQFPFYFDKETGKWSTEKSTWWSSGFFAGTLWLIYDYTKDEFFKTAASKWTEGMAVEQDNGSDADIGYKILNSALLGYKFTGQENYKAITLSAAKTLATRYNDRLGVVKGYDMADLKLPLVIDHMMNIDLLWWGAANGGDPNWKTMAEKHSLATMEKTIRPDGSSIQMVDLDPTTGAVTKNTTLCGISGESVWARGQGEGIYGFAIAYRETKNPLFLEAFKKLADYFLANLPADSVPYWDFKEPMISTDPANALRDASAASMTADGLLEMTALLPDSPDKIKYYNAAVTILDSLAKNYMTKGTTYLGVIDHASFQGPDKKGADTILTFGDFNFLSALKKYEAQKNL